MSTDAAKLIVGLAAAVGTALLVFARKHGAAVELAPLVPGEPDDPAVERAEREIALWGWGELKESQPAAAPLLAKYWRACGLSPQPPGTAWSAAFISYVGGGALYAAANHIGYARNALRSRLQGEQGVYWAHAPNESGVLPLRRGDLVLTGRGQPVTWADVAADTGHKDAHGQIVVATRGVVSLIGGNESDSVRQSHLAEGVLPPNTFAVLRVGSSEAWA